MSTTTRADREFCAQLACVPGSPFLLTYRYLDGREADRALAFEALFQSVRDIAASVSDPGVGLAKLAWWCEEVLSDKGVSQHPVKRLLDHAGATPGIDPDIWRTYIAGVAGDFEERTFTSVVELERYLRKVGGAQALMLAGGGGGIDSPVTSLGAASSLYQMICQLAGPQAVTSWVPLDLQARFPLPGGGLGDPANRLAAESLVVFLCETALAWLKPDPGEVVPGLDQGGWRFLAVRAAVERRLLRRARSRPARVLNGLLRTGFMEVFSAWRRARRDG